MTDIKRGYYHTLALRSDGTVWGWGNSGTGALGIDPGWLPGPLVNMGLSGVTLTAATVGPGAGSLHSIPPGIACSGGLCSYSFPYGALVTLHPTSSGDSLFAGWSGACSGTGDCVMYMTSEKTVYAHFTPAHPVRIGNTPYGSLAEAYVAAGSGALVRSVEGELEGLTADRGVAVTLSGGYYGDFSGRSGLHTRLRGKLVVRGGSVRVDRITVM